MRGVRRWVARIIGILTILFIVAGLISFFFRPNEPPKLDDAPWVIQTFSQDAHKIPSRYYYLEDLQIVDGHAVSIGYYWTYDGDVYHKHKDEIKINLEYATILRRTQ